MESGEGREREREGGEYVLLPLFIIIFLLFSVYLALVLLLVLFMPRVFCLCFRSLQHFRFDACGMFNGT